MIYGVGTDIVEIGRITVMISKHKQFVENIYTKAEAAYCQKQGLPSFAGRFAAKEAVVKALGHGMNGWSFRDVEILSDAAGKPLVCCHRQAAAYCREQNIAKIHVSISHSRELAIAYAVAEQNIFDHGIQD